MRAKLGISNNKVNADTLGAWIFKCNPKIFDIQGFIDEGNHWVDDWTIADNYRSNFLLAGQPAILWVSGPTQGSKGDPIPGIWGIGHTAGTSQWSAWIETDKIENGFWIDKKKGQAANYWVPLDLDLLKKPLARKIIKEDPILRNAEIFRQPQGSNPTFLNREEYQALRMLIKKWPAPAEEPDIEISVGSTGAGFGSAETNKIVEERAMTLVAAHYKSNGYRVVDVSSKKLGWDLTATSRIDVRNIRHVEVKGVSGNSPKVFLTRNESKKATENPLWELAVVVKALSKKPKVFLYRPRPVWEAAKPFMWQADMTNSDSFNLLKP